jgi:phosphoribosyl-AMP cyclohydrolase / phosphoribosyl-ATP pyrophosphohydrolase
MQPKFDRTSGLIPAIIQDSLSQKVLMLGYMNQEAFEVTNATGKVTFFSRSKQRLWTKGETSGHFLLVKGMQLDCDLDTLLVKAEPLGSTCHLGNETCWNETSAKGFLSKLEGIIQERKLNPKEGSYTNSLFGEGSKKIAQKVGEEATEVILEAMAGNRELLISESADLLYHFLVLLADQQISLEEVEHKLQERHG